MTTNSKSQMAFDTPPDTPHAGGQVSAELTIRAFAAAPQAMLTVDANRYIQLANPAVCAITGMQDTQLIGLDFMQLWTLPSQAELNEHIVPVLEQRGYWEGELHGRRPDGTIYTHLVSLHVLTTPWRWPGEMLVVLADSASRKAHERRLYQLAYFDPMTQLANRVQFMDRLTHALDRARRARRMLCLLFIDLDGFKAVNDTYGHATGDEVLREVGQRLTRSLRAMDTVARLGGDEFALLQEDTQRPQDAAVLACKLIQALNQPLELNGQTIQIGASIGISLYPLDGDDPQILIDKADLAMYRAKRAGTNQYAFHHDTLNLANRHRLDREQALQKALKTDVLELVFLPERDPYTDVITALAATFRSQDAPIAPEQLLSLATQAGILDTVWHTLLAQIAHSRRQGLIMPICVRLTCAQGKLERLFGQLEGIFRQYGLAPQGFELEIPIQGLGDVPRRVNPGLRHLNALGIKSALVDIDAANLRLSWLHHCQAETLKLAPRFMAQSACDLSWAKLTQGLVTLAHGLDKRVVALGANTPSLRTHTQAIGCDAYRSTHFLTIAELLG